MEKSLPPLPLRDAARSRAPARLPQRAFLAERDQPRFLPDKVEQLGRQLAEQRAKLDEKDRRIAELTSEKRKYGERLLQQKQAVVDLADAIGAAFQECEQRIRQQDEAAQAAADAPPADIESCYAEVLSAWDDTSSSDDGARSESECRK